ncbi:MAG: hypothetical protein P8Z76_16290 [Alphaproteobacteria bacterium]
MDIFGGVIRSDQLIWLGSLLIAFAFVLWGGKLFKIFVVVLGIGAGLLIGFFVGSIVGLGPQGGGAGAVIGAIVLGLLAWPLHRVFVFLIGGLFFGFVTASIATSLQVPETTLNAAAVAGFVVGGVLSILIHKTFVIALMAACGAQTILSIMFSKSFLPIATFEAFMRNYAGFYAQRLGLFLTIVGVYVAFALFLQIVCAPTEKEKAKAKFERLAAKARIRRILYLFAFIQLIGWTLTRLAPAASGFDHPPITGITLLSWPAAAILSALVLNWAWEGTAPVPLREKASKAQLAARYVLFVVIGAVIPPLITGMLHRIFFSQGQFLFLYEAVVDGPVALLIFKAAFLLVVFPSFMMMATHTRPPPEPVPAEAADPARAKAA